jgi:hypothetical protein
MTPLQIEILLHYWSRAEDYRQGDFSAPAVREAIDWFMHEGMLERNMSADRLTSYRTTDRAQAWIRHVTDLPLPTMTWVIEAARPNNPNSASCSQ